tara:strand:+ start:1476 stop:1928 length:453 start_codon:yes stop_codon:yes gene_type:complete
MINEKITLYFKAFLGDGLGACIYFISVLISIAVMFVVFTNIKMPLDLQVIAVAILFLNLGCFEELMKKLKKFVIIRSCIKKVTKFERKLIVKAWDILSAGLGADVVAKYRKKFEPPIRRNGNIVSDLCFIASRSYYIGSYVAIALIIIRL